MGKHVSSYLQDCQNDLIDILGRRDHPDMVLVSARTECPLLKELRSRGHVVERWCAQQYNLGTTKGYNQALERLELTRPKHLFLEPPLNSYGTQNTHAQRSHNARVKRTWRQMLLLCQRQQSLGGYFYFQAPQNPLWSQLAEELEKTIGTSYTVLHDLCMDGFRHPETKLLVKATVRIQTNNAKAAEGLQRRCDGHGGTLHGRMEADSLQSLDLSLPTAFWHCWARLLDMGDSLLAVVEQKLRSAWQEMGTCSDEMRVHRACCDGGNTAPTLLAAGVYDTLCQACEPEEHVVAPVMDELQEDESESKRKLLRVHRNLGHPPQKLFLRVLREAGAPQSVLDDARELQCDVCDRFRKSAPARPVNVERARDLGEVLSNDFPHGRKELHMHLIDMSSQKNAAS